jgi:hypothetical protein
MFNPDKVPSSSMFTGSREPVCEPCMNRINMKRVAAGLPPFPIMQGAYGIADESGE